MANSFISRLTHDEKSLADQFESIKTEIGSSFQSLQGKTGEFICKHKVETLNHLFHYLRNEKERPTAKSSVKFHLIDFVIDICSSDPVPTLDELVSTLQRILQHPYLPSLFYLSFLRNFHVKFFLCKRLCAENQFDLIKSILESFEKHLFIDEDLNQTEKSEWIEFLTGSMFSESDSNANKLTHPENMERIKDSWRTFYQFAVLSSKKSEIWRKVSSNIERVAPNMFHNIKTADDIYSIIETGTSALIENSLKVLGKTFESNKAKFQAKLPEILKIIEKLILTKHFCECCNFMENFIFPSISSENEIDQFISLMINIPKGTAISDRNDFFYYVMMRVSDFLKDFRPSMKMSVRYFAFAEAMLSLKVNSAPEKALRLLKRENFYSWKDLSSRMGNLVRLCADYETIEDDKVERHALSSLEELIHLIQDRAAAQRTIFRHTHEQAQIYILRWSAVLDEKNPKFLAGHVYRMGRALVALIDIEQVNSAFCTQIAHNLKVQFQIERLQTVDYLDSFIKKLASSLGTFMGKLKVLNEDFHRELSSFILIAMEQDIQNENGSLSLAASILQSFQNQISECLRTENDVQQYNLCLKKLYSLTHGDDHEFYMSWWKRFWSTKNEAILKCSNAYIDELLTDLIDRDASEFYAALNVTYSQQREPFHKRIDDLINLAVGSNPVQRVVVSNLLINIVKEFPDIINQNHLEKLCKYLNQTPSLGDTSGLVVLILMPVSDSQPMIFSNHQKQLLSLGFDRQNYPAAKCVTNYFVASSIVDGEKAANEYLTSLINVLKKGKRMEKWTRELLFHTIQTIGVLYRDLLQSKRNEFLSFKSYIECRVLLDFIDQRKLNPTNQKMFQSIQDEIEQIQQKLHKTENDAKKVSHVVKNQGINLQRVNEKVQTVQSEVVDLTGRVDSQQREIGRIDSKTLSFVPEEWGRAVCKLLNVKTNNDWRLLGKRFGYSNSELRHWSLKADPTMMLLNEWFMTHKTDEATYGLLKMLEEIGRTDVSKTIRTAAKAAGQIIPNELPMEIKRLPPVFLSYQWNSQKMVTNLKENLAEAGFSCWMDIGQMGGGDKLFSKIDAGIRGAKVVICCINKSYSLSDNCLREVHLAISTGKPIIPMQMEKIDWPPEGSLGPIMSEYLYIRFYDRKSNMPDYWPADKFSELLGQIRYFVAPDYDMITKKYQDWFLPKIDRSIFSQITHANIALSSDDSSDHNHIHPQVMISYQWDRQTDILLLYERLNRLGYRCWLDLFQMAGGDSLFEKIDQGVRHAKCILACVTPKYIKSANCRREMLLSDSLGKVIIPLLLETTETWPPPGPMGPIFTERVFIDFRKSSTIPQSVDIWSVSQFDTVLERLQNEIPEVTLIDNSKTVQREVNIPQHVDLKTDDSKKVESKGVNLPAVTNRTASTRTVVKKVESKGVNLPAVNSNRTISTRTPVRKVQSKTIDPPATNSNMTDSHTSQSKTKNINMVNPKTKES